MTEGRGGVSECSLADDLVWIDSYGFTGERKGFVGFARGEQLVGVLGAAESGDLVESVP